MGASVCVCVCRDTTVLLVFVCVVLVCLSMCVMISLTDWFLLYDIVVFVTQRKILKIFQKKQKINVVAQKN